MKQKFDLEVFDDAAELCETTGEYACLALGQQVGGYKSREFFTAIFLKTYTTFGVMHQESFGTIPTPDEMQDIRVMAICFAREIARLKNGKKNSGFSPADIKNLYSEYDKQCHGG